MQERDSPVANGGVIGELQALSSRRVGAICGGRNRFRHQYGEGVLPRCHNLKELLFARMRTGK